MSTSTRPANAHVFEKRTVIQTTLEKMMAFHHDPSALPKLTPPPIFVQMHRDDRKSLTEGELEFTLWLGFIPLRWLVRHETGPTPDSFTDQMISGPMAYWRHDHIFEQVDGGIALIDRLVLAHKGGLVGLFTRLMFDGVPLRIFFAYRHWRTRLSTT